MELPTPIRLLLMVGYGVTQWVEQPQVRKLKVVTGQDPRDNSVSTNHTSRTPLNPRLLRHHVGTDTRQNTRLIVVVDPRNPQRTLRLCIDVMRQRLNNQWTSRELLGRVPTGSGYVEGLMQLASAPLALLVSPVLIPMHYHYKQLEQREGMSRHSVAILKALQGQLDQDTEKLLRNALRRDWRERQLANIEPSVEEAEELLKKYDLQVTQKHQDGTDQTQGEYLAWINDMGDQVAVGYLDLERDRDHQVSFGRSRFSGEGANRLMKCYRTRRDLVQEVRDKMPSP